MFAAKTKRLSVLRRASDCQKSPRGIGGPQPSDCQSETSGVYCGPNPTSLVLGFGPAEAFGLSSCLDSLRSSFRWFRNPCTARDSYRRLPPGEPQAPRQTVQKSSKKSPKASFLTSCGSPFSGEPFIVPLLPSKPLLNISSPHLQSNPLFSLIILPCLW